ncbi:MAG: UDP-3-O-(3-hydroxymyristoyl)glucosamine N-acyltransferase [Gammaproteobacteria bacterium]
MERLGDIASRFEVELVGSGEIEITGVATLSTAGPGKLTFLANSKYRKYLASTCASAVVLSPDDVTDCPVAALVSSNPYATYAKIAQYLYPLPEFEPGIHPAAVIDSSAKVDSSAYIGPSTVIEAGVSVGQGACIGPGCVIRSGSRIGDFSRLTANVTVMERTLIATRCLIHPGVVIGADGFGIAQSAEGWIKVPQLGAVVIGADVEVGANTTIDRGALDDTIIESGVKLDNQIQIAHNVRIGEHTAIAGCTAIAGSATIGKRCMIAGGVGIIGHISIADDCVITAMTLVTHSITEKGSYSGSLPMDEQQKWRRNSARYRQLDAMAKRLRKLEK